MSKLRFSVAACSAEDPAFPAAELNEHSAGTRGYMTPRNCAYPQELVLELADGLCRLTQVQLLSHETHIATKMELFVSSDRNRRVEDARFTRLGFLTLKSNVESGYQARELKTVHIDHEAALLKLRLHACHINDRNLYNQVGILAINLCGEPLGPATTDELPGHSDDKSLTKPKVKSKTQAADLGMDLRFDAKTAARIREIQVAKDQAVASEDYDQAKRLKQMEEQLKSIGLQLARLEAQKREAVANEDYDLAKQIKGEIGRLEASVGSNESQPILPIPAASPVKSQVLARHAAATSSSSFSPKDMYPEDVQAGKSHNVGGFYGNENVGRRPTSARGGGDDETTRERESATLENEQQVDDGGLNPHFRGIPDAEELPDPDELPAALAKESEELIEVIGPFFTRCVYSNLWNHRDAAIRKVTMELENYPHEPVQLLQVCSTLVQSGAGDRIAQVALSAFRLVDRMVEFGARVRRDDMCHILGNSMTQLVNKLGEPQAKVRDEAGAVLGRLAAADNVGVAFVAQHLTKRSKKPLGLKFLLGRLLVLQRLLTRFELLPESDFSVAGIMGFLEDSNCLAHQSREIRDAAKDITVAMYKIVGSDVEGYLKALRPKQLEEYQAAFEAVDEAQATNSRPSGGAGPRDQHSEPVQTELEQEDAESDDESVDEYTCPFCGVVDERFDSDFLDQHFWSACKMLTPCKMCGQVIEVATLNEHLLAECELQQNHRECPRCGEAITTKFFERHVSLNDCPPRQPPHRASRCPLCHDDIAPRKKGWRRHLMEEGCPNNPRS